MTVPVLYNTMQLWTDTKEDNFTGVDCRIAWTLNPCSRV